MRGRELTSDEQLRAVLCHARTIAVLGAHDEPSRPAFYVPQYLYERGCRILPVNPRRVGCTLWGQPVRATLAELGEPVDFVDVFRAAKWLPDHDDDLLAMRPLPPLVWLQLGVRHDAVCRRLCDAGIDVVQDRCAMAEHRRLCS